MSAMSASSGLMPLSLISEHKAAAGAGAGSGGGGGQPLASSFTPSSSSPAGDSSKLTAAAGLIAASGLAGGAAGGQSAESAVSKPTANGMELSPPLALIPPTSTQPAPPHIQPSGGSNDSVGVGGGTEEQTAPVGGETPGLATGGGSGEQPGSVGMPSVPPAAGGTPADLPSAAVVPGAVEPLPSSSVHQQTGGGLLASTPQASASAVLLLPSQPPASSVSTPAEDLGQSPAQPPSPQGEVSPTEERGGGDGGGGGGGGEPATGGGGPDDRAAELPGEPASLPAEPVAVAAPVADQPAAAPAPPEPPVPAPAPAPASSAQPSESAAAAPRANKRTKTQPGSSSTTKKKEPTVEEEGERRKKERGGEEEEEEAQREERGKRKRLPTQVYQAPIPEERDLIAKITKIDKPPVSAEEKLIVFYKNEFLAVRNAEGSFYICQAMQNVYKSSSKIKIRWLSQVENTDYYSPDFYDNTEFDCILTNLNMERLEKNKFRLPDVEAQRTGSILKRALDVENGLAPPPETSVTEEHPDGLDLSLYRNENQLKKRKSSGRSKSHKKRVKKPVATSSSSSSAAQSKKVATSREVGKRSKPTPAAVQEVKKPATGSGAVTGRRTAERGRVVTKVDKPVVQRILAAKKTGRRKAGSAVTKPSPPAPAPQASSTSSKEAVGSKKPTGSSRTAATGSSGGQKRKLPAEPSAAAAQSPVAEKKLKSSTSKTKSGVVGGPSGPQPGTARPRRSRTK